MTASWACPKLRPMKSVVDRLSETLQIPSDELINRGLLAYLERELRNTEEDIADIREKYSVADRSDLDQKIAEKQVSSHPAWEDLISWENADDYITSLKREIKRLL